MGTSANESGEADREWQRLVDVARRENKPGNVITLADEAPSPVMALEARRDAGMALARLSQLTYALEQFEAALELDPADAVSRCQKGIMLGRIGRHAEARQWMDGLREDSGRDPEVWAASGRVARESWTSGWLKSGEDVTWARAAARAAAGSLRDAISSYRTAFTLAPLHYSSGMNAATLTAILEDLGEEVNAADSWALRGAVQWAVAGAIAARPGAYWPRMTQAELFLLENDLAEAAKAFRSATGADDCDVVSLDATRQQLVLMRRLGFRPEVVEPGLAEIDHAMAQAKRPFAPDKVFLFSGHMVDAPGRFPSRFPAEAELVAARAVAAALDQLRAGGCDLGLCGGAAGGDILFAEECLRRGLKLDVYLPLDEPAFMSTSVSFAGERWRDRYFATKRNPLTTVYEMAVELGPAPEGVDLYSRNNRWQLHTALSYGAERLRFVSLWDGQEGDGPGGTRDMVKAVTQRSGEVHILDTRTLWPSTADLLSRPGGGAGAG